MQFSEFNEEMDKQKLKNFFGCGQYRAVFNRKNIC